MAWCAPAAARRRPAGPAGAADHGSSARAGCRRPTSAAAGWWWPRPGPSSGGACRSATASRSAARDGRAGLTGRALAAGSSWSAPRSATSATCRPRAAAALAAADVIFCEDTRRTRKLLSAAGIPAPRLLSHAPAQRGGLGCLRRRAGGRRAPPSPSSPTPACPASPTRGSGWCGPAADAGIAGRGGSRAVGVADRPGGVRAAGRAVLLRRLPAPTGPGARRSGCGQSRPRDCTTVLYEAPHRVVAHPRRPGRRVRARTDAWPSAGS